MKYEILEPKKAIFGISLEVMTPLLQIEPTSSMDKDPNTKASMVRTKKRRYLSENGKYVNVPFFSANGFRGIMRRNIAATLFAKLKETDKADVSVATAHLYASGGGTTNEGIAGLSYQGKADFRKNNPYLSLFGAGLSDIDGKLSVTDMAPADKDGKLIDFLFGVRFDETERASMLSPLIDAASVDEYKEMLKAKRSENKALRAVETSIEKIQKEIENNGKDEVSSGPAKELEELKAKAAKIVEEKGMSYQQVYKAEFIIPGTKLYSSIGTRAGYELTDIEKGMMLYGAIKTSQQSIGSYSRIGWGILNWDVQDAEGRTLFTSVADEKYLLNRTLVVSKEGEKVLKPFLAYVDELTRDGIYMA